MRSICILSIFCILSFFCTFMSYSQQTELTLKKAIDNGLNTNVNILKAQYTIESQSGFIKTKYGSLFPTLSLSGGWTRTNAVSSTGVVNVNGIPYNYGSSNTTSNNYNLSLRSDLTLFNGFTNYQDVEVSRMTQTANYIQYEKSKQDLVLKIIDDYITALKNQQVLQIDIASLEDSKSQLEKIKKFVEAGTKTISDVYNQDALVATNELAVEQAKNTLDKSIADLVFDANLSQNVQYNLNINEFNTNITYDDMQAYVTQNSNVDALVNVAFKNRTDYKFVEQNLLINQENLDIARNSVLFPTISGFSTYNLSAPQIQNINNSRVFTIGLTFSYPIFEGFSIDNQKQLAEIQVKSSSEDVTQLRNQVNVDIKKSVLDLNSLLKQIDITDRNIKAAAQNKFLAEESYRVGLQTLLDVQTATINYNNALIIKTNVIYNFILAQKQLEYLEGLIK